MSVCLCLNVSVSPKDDYDDASADGEGAHNKDQYDKDIHNKDNKTGATYYIWPKI